MKRVIWLPVIAMMFTTAATYRSDEERAKMFEKLTKDYHAWMERLEHEAVDSEQQQQNTPPKQTFTAPNPVPPKNVQHATAAPAPGAIPQRKSMSPVLEQDKGNNTVRIKLPTETITVVCSNPNMLRAIATGNGDIAAQCALNVGSSTYQTSSLIYCILNLYFDKQLGKCIAQSMLPDGDWKETIKTQGWERSVCIAGKTLPQKFWFASMEACSQAAKNNVDFIMQNCRLDYSNNSNFRRSLLNFTQLPKYKGYYKHIDDDFIDHILAEIGSVALPPEDTPNIVHFLLEKFTEAYFCSRYIEERLPYIPIKWKCACIRELSDRLSEIDSKRFTREYYAMFPLILPDVVVKNILEVLNSWR